MFLQFLFKEMDIEIIKKENFIPEFLNFNFKVNLFRPRQPVSKNTSCRDQICFVSNTGSGNNEEYAACESDANYGKP